MTVPFNEKEDNRHNETEIPKGSGIPATNPPPEPQDLDEDTLSYGRRGSGTPGATGLPIHAEQIDPPPMKPPKNSE